MCTWFTAPPPPKAEVPKKNVPQPSNPLKSFNWSKLPDAKVQGTVWSELDESKWYNNMELESIDKLFSAYQKNGVVVSGWPTRILLKYLIWFHLLQEWWLCGRSKSYGQAAHKDTLRHRWTTCTKLHDTLEQIKDEWWGDLQVSKNNTSRYFKIKYFFTDRCPSMYYCKVTVTNFLSTSLSIEPFYPWTAMSS